MSGRAAGAHPNRGAAPRYRQPDEGSGASPARCQLAMSVVRSSTTSVLGGLSRIADAGLTLGNGCRCQKRCAHACGRSPRCRSAAVTASRRPSPHPSYRLAYVNPRAGQMGYDESFGALLTNELETRRFKVEAATDGADALARICMPNESERPDHLLLRPGLLVRSGPSIVLTISAATGYERIPAEPPHPVGSVLLAAHSRQAGAPPALS